MSGTKNRVPRMLAENPQISKPLPDMMQVILVARCSEVEGWDMSQSGRREESFELDGYARRLRHSDLACRAGQAASCNGRGWMGMNKLVH